MSTNATIEHSENIILYWLDDDFDVDLCDLVFETICKSLDPEKRYRELILFSPSARLSNIAASDLRTIMASMIRHYEKKNIVRSQSAIVSGSRLFHTMNNLWVAYASMDAEVEAEYQVFQDLESACGWLDLDKVLAKAFIAKHR